MADSGNSSEGLSAAAATATLGYKISQDIKARKQQKRYYLENLEKHYKMLYSELKKLIALETDMGDGVIMKEQFRSSNTYKVWRTKTKELETEVKDMVEEYERITKLEFSIKRSRKTLKFEHSKKMEEKYLEVLQHLRETKFMIA